MYIVCIFSKTILALLSLQKSYMKVSTTKGTKKASRTGQKKAETGTLTKSDLTKIRKFLPRDWRRQIHQSHTSIGLRQITEVYRLRSKNFHDNQIVWNAINKVLMSAGEQKLVEKVNRRLSFCSSLYTDILKR